MSTPSTEVPIASAGEAERVIESLNAITDQLEETIEEETAHVRAGRLRDAAELCEAKAEICRRYTVETMRRHRRPRVDRTVPARRVCHVA